jgi:hypothetical protein
LEGRVDSFFGDRRPWAFEVMDVRIIFCWHSFQNMVGKKRGRDRTRCLLLGTHKMNTFCNAQSDRDDITLFQSKCKTPSNVYRICEALVLCVRILTVFNADVVGSQDSLQQLFGIRNHFLILHNKQQVSRHVQANQEINKIMLTSLNVDSQSWSFVITILHLGN